MARAIRSTIQSAVAMLALALSPLPPMRQFGVVSACAFLLSMIADFTALPASLWLVSGDKPCQDPEIPT